ncbi:MAG: M23 family metallopeptidase [Burkholderiales bacterium]|nr:M23 family metallopeptidase [Burkholderiales bacterium]
MQRLRDLILTQKPLILERKIKLRWLVGLSSVPLFGIIAAFGFAPDSADKVPLQTVIEAIQLPNIPSQDGNIALWREEKIQRGDTIGTLLARLKVTDIEAVDFLRNPKNAHSLYQLTPGRLVQAKTDQNGKLLSLHYLNGKGDELVVARTENGLQSKEQTANLETRIQMKSASIDSSLFAATDSIGLPDSVATQIADMFASDIDFHRDLRKGDHFTVVYEMSYSNGEPVKTGRILAAEFINQGKSYRAVYFDAPGGESGYYTPEGKNLRKAFLRCPLPFSRITSGFTLARFHPFLQKWRAHKGVDFGAPIGTPVRATADGTVEFKGSQHGYGNLIVLQHQGKFSTAYGHLSRFAGGLHRGEKISQGEVIGYVGMTGWATGPHLHYEFRINDTAVDPMKAVLPGARPINPQYASAFRVETRALAERLNLMRSVDLANLD